MCKTIEQDINIKHLDNLIKHIDLVRQNCIVFGKNLIEQGKLELGKKLIIQGFLHDISKFSGIEWEYLHQNHETASQFRGEAIKHHVITNQHHPEYWGDINKMPELYLYEMVADWKARSEEFHTDLSLWIINVAVPRFKINEETLNKIKEIYEYARSNGSNYIC